MLLEILAKNYVLGLANNHTLRSVHLPSPTSSTASRLPCSQIAFMSLEFTRQKNFQQTGRIVVL